jgi:hypothetical protein
MAEKRDSSASAECPDRPRRDSTISVDWPPAPTAVRKRYTAPRLTLYGDLDSITRATFRGDKNDHAHGSTKTG